MNPAGFLARLSSFTFLSRRDRIFIAAFSAKNLRFFYIGGPESADNELSSTGGMDPRPLRGPFGIVKSWVGSEMGVGLVIGRALAECQ